MDKGLLNELTPEEREALDNWEHDREYVYADWRSAVSVERGWNAHKREFTVPALPQRMWINQPSASQPYHSMHGVRVMAVDYGNGYSRVYPVVGDTVSMEMATVALEPGWPPRKGEPTYEELCWSLCHHDPRYPIHDSLFDEDYPPGTPGKDCACDACSYGTHPLADELLRRREGR